MAVYTHEPKYPVVDPDPKVFDSVTNFNVTDLAFVIGWPVVGYAFCFYRGKTFLFISDVLSK